MTSDQALAAILSKTCPSVFGKDEPGIYSFELNLCCRAVIVRARILLTDQGNRYEVLSVTEQKVSKVEEKPIDNVTSTIAITSILSKSCNLQ